MSIVSIQEVVEWNEKILLENLGFKIHLRDACGSQSFWIEELREGQTEGDYQKLYTILDSFFIKKKLTVAFSEDKMNFWTCREKKRI